MPHCQLPLYRSRKTVRACRIGDVFALPHGGARIVPADAGVPPFDVSAEYVAAHAPDPGGYYVECEREHDAPGWRTAVVFESMYELADREPEAGEAEGAALAAFVAAFAEYVEGAGDAAAVLKRWSAYLDAAKARRLADLRASTPKPAASD